MIILLFFTHIFHTASQPLFESGLSNPAFSSYSGTYEAHITANENFIFDYLSAGAQIKNAGISFATYRDNYYSQSWAGISYRFPFPLAMGVNLGTAQVYQQSHFLTDLGLWFNYGLLFGISYRDILHDERLLRAGATYKKNRINIMCEIENGGEEHNTSLNIGIGYLYCFSDLEISAFGGYNFHNPAFTIGLTYYQFKLGFLLSDSFEVNLMVSIFLEPPVREKIIVFQETLEVFVQKPTSTKKPLAKKIGTTAQLTPNERLSCEQHYLKGIEYYINNLLDEAINEWNIVVKISPTYKDVKRYLENANAKKELLKKEK
ncbi:hypothetical protein A2Y85_05830 [candidate division WOR-3 bacterium RBG_13_43_14]|uniref:Uncharacterized protein n=1 Tax=candidate division WOR-3 bacterium RBG_13_43_14 TaxID=1802590 RepID=A0A1F4U920_UNCW3|nr:MAG: hypothetical protein A2Y85_05830 [candidate division WOR-3 bacterium RBG_13_43_14]